MFDFLLPPLRGERYEPDVSGIILQLHGKLAVDVGSSLGQHTVELAPRFKRVIAIEPNPENLPLLRRNLKRSRLDNVEVVCSAISDFDGMTELHLNPENPYGGATILGKSRSHLHVQVMKLDTLLHDAAEVDFVKVDAEGAEWNILKGAESAIPKIKGWVIELHDPSRKNELNTLLRSYGYATEWLKNPGRLPHVYAFREV